jgi:REP-associated tyrosine transposase
LEFRLQAVPRYAEMMSATGYLWRQLNPKQREELLEWRKARGHPWHSPPHRPNFGHLRFHISAACYEHRDHIGQSLPRIDNFTRDLLAVLAAHANQTFAWCVLPNHYHALVEAADIKRLVYQLGRLHGRTSHAWNAEERTSGRKVFFRAVERAMRSDRHYWATLNYVHHNPVRHAYVERWTDWPWSSAAEYLAQTGASKAERVWREYPLHEYGKNWDDPEM